MKVNQAFYDSLSRKETINFTAGHSLGTVFATKLAVDNQVANLVLLAPAINLKDIIFFQTSDDRPGVAIYQCKGLVELPHR